MNDFRDKKPVSEGSLVEPKETKDTGLLAEKGQYMAGTYTRIGSEHRVFCSYTLSNEKKEVVSERMRSIINAFNGAGVDSYCNLFDIKTNDLTCPKKCLDIAIKELETCDIVFVVMSERRSEGMLIEVGVAYAAGKPIILARHENANGKTYVDRLADITMDWKTNEDLKEIINRIITQ